MEEGRGRARLPSDSSIHDLRTREARPAAIEPFGLELPRRPTQTGEVLLRNLAGVKFREAGQVYEADAGERRYARGESVIIETKRGLALGYIALPSERRFTDNQIELRIVRRVEENDLRQMDRNTEREREAFYFCLTRIRERRLKMKLIRTEVLHGGNKAIFYFSAEGRVDFRELVKDLAHKLHLRIEMRQVGVRDEAKLVGGVGACGRELCCSTWLKDFAPVSLKMAKDQNLALNPQKVSGVCGRLMCCLSYEEHSYREIRKTLPRVGKMVMTPKGEGRVVELDVLRQRVRVAFDEFAETFPLAELKAHEAATQQHSEAAGKEISQEAQKENEERAQREERRQRSRRMLERRGIHIQKEEQDEDIPPSIPPARPGAKRSPTSERQETGRKPERSSRAARQPRQEKQSRQERQERQPHPERQGRQEKQPRQERQEAGRKPERSPRAERQPPPEPTAQPQERAEPRRPRSRSHRRKPRGQS